MLYPFENYQEEIYELVRSRDYREALGLPESVEEEYRFLAAGEYNANLCFTHPITGRKLLLRLNYGSQMQLSDQIGYEARALRILEKSGRTPKLWYADGSKRFLPRGILVMDFLPGRPLDYGRDLHSAAEILSDIHALQVDRDCGLLCPEDSVSELLLECGRLLLPYREKVGGESAERILQLYEKAVREAKREKMREGARSIINTELNSGNFLINSAPERSYLIDWEKPIYGLPAQDLGHFLAPTTSFWKSDAILSSEERACFLSHYLSLSEGRFDCAHIREDTERFLRLNCIRGLCWCAMAYTKYREGGGGESFEKIKAYLRDPFLSCVEEIWASA